MQVLGKRLGKAVKPVGNAIRAMSPEAIAAFESSGEVTLAGHTLHAGDIKVRLRVLGCLDFKCLDAFRAMSTEAMAASVSIVAMVLLLL